MTFRLHCFAALRDHAGAAEITIELPEGADVPALKAALEARYPGLAGRLGSVRVAADLEFLAEDALLPAGAELALIPPVSGGAPGPGESDASVDALELKAAPLSLDAALAAVRGPDAGALVTFVGTVRAQSRGGAVTHLEYEVYAEMALDRLERIARSAREATGALRVAIHHRTGRVGVGEDSVVIAVAATHRAAAFDAARRIIEALKADVPIWKRECFADGAVWVGWGS